MLENTGPPQPGVLVLILVKSATTILVFSVACLLALGVVMLYSSSMVQVGARYLLMQLVWCGLGITLCIAAALIDYQHLKKISWLLLLVAIAGLALVLVVGREINGARRWLEFGAFRLQPSEFAKLALIIALAHYGERFQRHMPTFGKGLFAPSLFIAVVLGLIFVEPDRGSTALLGAVCGVMLLLAGVQWKFFVPPALMAVTAFVISLWHDPIRLRRLLSWMDPEATKDGAGWQAWQAKIALGAGGWSGLGLGNGRQKLGFVPEHHTDFIFSIIGEELGLIATITVLILFIVFVICGIVIASRACDPFGFLLASGITFLIGLQAFINIGVVTGVLPNKGLPLPFISYGGSNLLMTLAGVGLLLSVARQATAPALAKRNRRNPFGVPSAQTS